MFFSDLYQPIIYIRRAMKPILSPDFIQTNFPSLQNMTYLNNAASGIPPQATIDAMKNYLDGRVKAESLSELKDNFEVTLEGFKKVRNRLAALLGGDSACYGLAPSTSGGLNIFAHGIEYPEGSNIVICDLEFPANYVPWQNAARLYRAELRVVKSENGGIDQQELEESIDENTRVVAVSLVQFGSGYRTDVKKLARLAHDNGAYLVSDIIQAAGWMDIDLPKLDVDFAAAQAAKWLIGPIGAGFIYAKKEVIPQIDTRFLGWWSVQDMKKFEYAQRVPFSDAKKFEVGSPAMIAYVGLRQSLRVLLEIPAKEREQAAVDNANHLRKLLSERSIEYYDFPDENLSPIVSCAPRDVEELNKELNKNHIYCSVRNGRLRVSPHFYNTRTEIETVVEMMR